MRRSRLSLDGTSYTTGLRKTIETMSVAELEDEIESLEVRLASKQTALASVSSIARNAENELADLAAVAAAKEREAGALDASTVAECAALVAEVRANAARVAAAQSEEDRDGAAADDDDDDDARDLEVLAVLRDELAERVAGARKEADAAEARAIEVGKIVEEQYAAAVKERELDRAAESCKALEAEASALAARIGDVRDHVAVLVERNGGTDEMYPLPLPPPSQYEADMALFADALA